MEIPGKSMTTHFPDISTDIPINLHVTGDEIPR